MDLATAADLAQVAGLVAILGGGIVALVQIRHARQQRADQAAIEMVHTLQTPELIDDMLRILRLHEPSAETIRNDAAVERAALHTIFAAELLGCMVFERVIRLEVLDRVCGGFVRGSWARLRPWVEEERARTGIVNLAEWFEWLDGQLRQHPEASKAVGAHVVYRSWRP